MRKSEPGQVACAMTVAPTAPPTTDVFAITSPPRSSAMTVHVPCAVRPSLSDRAMSPAAGFPRSDAPYLDIARRVMLELFGPAHERRFAVRYWSGFLELAGYANAPPYTIVIRAPSTLRRMLWPPTELTLAEAFVHGDIDVEGDLTAAASFVGPLAERLSSPRRLARLAALLIQLPQGRRDRDPRTVASAQAAVGSASLAGRRHTPARDAAAIRYHYDVGNEFYGLWLDNDRVYSCAYFVTGEEDLETAQRAKLDLICRKLRLRPGERLLDIGCGWGGLVRHAVRYYGVEALGITLSPAQCEYANARVRDEGLAAHCRIEVRDYRDLPATLTFDKVASVGMFEHVGRRQLPAYFRAALRATRPGGLFLNHGIVSLADARDDPAGTPGRRLRRKGEFMRRYVFPDGELVALATALEAAEGVGLEIRDLESLREHYALTLRHWVRRLEARADAAVRLVGPTTYRVWRLYMAACAFAFDTAQIGVTQMLFGKPDPGGECRIPRTRADLFAPVSVPPDPPARHHVLSSFLPPEVLST